MAYLNIGTDMSGRAVTPTIPDAAEFTETKIVVKGYGNAKITEIVDNGEVTVIYETATDSGILYNRPVGEAGVNTAAYLPDDFGVITEVDETAISYVYLSRTDHEKTYAVTEDMAKVEMPLVTPIEKGGTNATTGANALKNFFEAGPTILSSEQYGDSLPNSAPLGRLFFLKVT